MTPRLPRLSQLSGPSTVVQALLEHHASPLVRRVRGAAIADLARDIAGLDALADGNEPQLVTAVVLRATQVAIRLEEELAAADRRWDDFARAYLGCADDRQRRALLADHLTETVPDARRKRADLAARDRFLDFDAVRERHLRQRHRRLAAIEVAVSFIGRGAEAALLHTEAAPDELFADLCHGRVDAFLRERGESGPRWTIRLAALEGLLGLTRAAPQNASGRFDATTLGAAVRCATRRDEHPWVQGAALELVLVVSPDVGETLLSSRLLDHADAPPRDFLVRRQIVDLLGRDGDTAALAILVRAVAGADPSEHVRIGLGAAIAACDGDPDLRALRPVLGLEGAGETSPKVRAAAVEAVVRAGADAGRHAGSRTLAAAGLLAETLERDTHPLPLAAACDGAARLALARGGELGDRLERLLVALLRLSARPDRPPAVHEAAAAAAETVARVLDPARDAWTRHLAEAAAAVPVGASRPLPVLQPHLPPLPDDPRFVGRILAELSRTGQGLTASRRGRRLILHRGDRFRRRLWRILHELRAPLPNKRQAHLHSVGRSVRGELRAPPGAMAEVTATAVPGERVQIAGEGGWGRHVPTVDDLLDLPLDGAPVHLFSSHGVTTVRPPPSLAARLRNRLAMSVRYGDLAALRTASLAGAEPRERQRFLDELRRRYGIETSFARHPYPIAAPAPPAHVTALFADEPAAEAEGVGAPVMALAPLPLFDWFDRHGYYFRSLHENGQVALALFLGAFAGAFFADAYRKRRRIARARRRIPLTIGGWGTRGKSGTERLKAALFHGLGYEVFVKTTGCEAMFIHSVPDEPPREVFIFRSYDKATIWEQRDMVELAADLGAEIFLWECMALNPQFVDLLQRDWMRDELVTLTNAYPDHEDVQGPAGVDIAQCISSFIPDRATLVTSELEFLPLFAERARQRGTELIPIGPRDGELLGADLLALFPYNEHPRNVALVARVAETLGVDRNLAIATMADHVVPDLGVLKTYPAARVRGRTVRFINGMSANERTGFLNNWQRMQLDAVDVVAEPARMVVTVVNNRWDRVSRSQVFAKIVVEDAAADAHLLIGTNLRGLRTYVDDALAEQVARLEVVVASDLGGSPDVPAARLARHMAKLRVPPPAPAHVVARLRAWAAGAGFDVDDTTRAGVAAAAAELLAPRAGAPLALARVRREVEGSFGELAGRLLPSRAAADGDPLLPEVVEPPTAADVVAHLVRHTARIVVHARLRARLDAVVASRDPAAIAGFDADFRAAYAELFAETVIVVDDAGATGDQIIDRCARAVPPGTDVAIMGIQNIKGTGLDFVYRWLALDQTQVHLRAARGDDAGARLAALRAVESFEDYGLVDAGLAASVLAASSAPTGSDEAVARERALRRVTAVHDERRRALGRTAGRDAIARLLGRVEAVLDPLDSIRRRRRAGRVMRDLVAQRISHARAAVEMRALYDRQKGGWLDDALRGGGEEEEP